MNGLECVEITWKSFYHSIQLIIILILINQNLFITLISHPSSSHPIYSVSLILTSFSTHIRFFNKQSHKASTLSKRTHPALLSFHELVKNHIRIELHFIPIPQIIAEIQLDIQIIQPETELKHPQIYPKPQRHDPRIARFIAQRFSSAFDSLSTPLLDRFRRHNAKPIALRSAQQSQQSAHHFDHAEHVHQIARHRCHHIRNLRLNSREHTHDPESLLKDIHRDSLHRMFHSIFDRIVQLSAHLLSKFVVGRHRTPGHRQRNQLRKSLQLIHAAQFIHSSLILCNHRQPQLLNKLVKSLLEVVIHPVVQQNELWLSIRLFSNKQIPRVRVHMEERSVENHRCEGLDAQPCDFLRVDSILSDLLHIVRFHSMNELHHAHSLRTQRIEHFRNIDRFVSLEKRATHFHVGRFDRKVDFSQHIALKPRNEPLQFIPCISNKQ